MCIQTEAQFSLSYSPIQGANRMRMRLGSMGGSFDRVSILSELYSPSHSLCEFQELIVPLERIMSKHTPSDHITLCGFPVV